MHPSAHAAASGGVTGGVRRTLQLEGAIVLSLCLLGYAREGGSWWWFAGAFFAPDLALLGYLGGARIGARLYNVAHSYIGPLLLSAVALTTPAPPWVTLVALIWAGHIGLDRMLGYGLKYDSAFADTHLGRVGRSS